MKAPPECIPCSVSQALRTAKMAGLDEESQKRAVKEAMRVLAAEDHDTSPAVIATKAIRAGEKFYPGIDPFEEIKWETTVEALAMYEHIRPGVMEDLSGMEPVERIRHCAKLAAAGNIIDFGVSSEFDLEGTLRETLMFLLISDNAGEIVFDRFLLDEAVRLGNEVYVSVKSGGILNDAIFEDAVRAGIRQPLKIIETGSSSLGLILEECTGEFKDLFTRAGVVLSKGQANYETLDDAARSVFFILRAKCPVLAGYMGVPTAASVLMHHSPGVRS
jgi:uncharacterized protein with ATP-grasp and redox domains